jgi:hypothetical protein
MANCKDNEVRVNSWNELQDELFSESWNPQLGRFRSRFAYRGLSDADYPLATTLRRLGGPYGELEKHLLRNFRKYATRNVVQGDSDWHWLSVAQHYGLPTRLMDWTYSPFVAMHFATATIEKMDTDGVIWAANYYNAHKMLVKRLRTVLDEEGANVFTVEMLSRCIPGLNELSKISKKPFLLFFEPPSMDDRIVNQFAFFSMLSDSDTDLDDFLLQKNDLYRKIIIPASLKWEIRDKLDQGNITERVLFPGLAGLSTFLKRQYSPKEQWSSSEHRLRSRR